MTRPFAFSLQRQDRETGARRGQVQTAHGSFPTPVFMPVATHGLFRAVRIQDVDATGARIVLANAYHLLVRPGLDRIRELGRLHRFMGWGHAILTDSGGFQITSLADRREITEDGIRFRSHVDGGLLFLDPERVMDLQRELGVDIAMVLDECTPHPYTPAEITAGLTRTLRWAERAVRRGVGSDQALFAITQGGTDSALRHRAACELAAMPFDGFAIGGLGIGEGREALWNTVAEHVPELPEARPRYLMGVGPPQDIVEAVAAGVDMFDCVIPTRNGRNGGVFTWDGPLNMKNAAHATDPRPIEAGCPCPACAHHHRGFLHHALRTGDSLSGSLLSLHNIHFFQRLMASIRDAIDQGTFGELRAHIHRAYPARPPGPRPGHPDR